MRILIAAFTIAFLTACQTRDLIGVIPGVVGPGYLQGHVSIGPLRPVEKAGEPAPTVPPQVYAARQIIIYHPDGQTVVTRLKLDDQGNYHVTLAPGEYVVNMVRVGIDRAGGLPAAITIQSGVTQTLDISIDTGIR